MGKSFITAKVVLWWLFTHYPSKVITTAPTWTQVETVLWGEIRSSLATSKIKLASDKDVLQVELKLAPDWFAKGISTSETVDQREFGSTKLQGFHSPNLLAVLDEAPGVNRAIHIAVETLATGANNRILKIGNPTSPTGPFYDNCFSPDWNKVKISCFDHPNIIEKREVIPGAVSLEWIERQRKNWGEKSPLYIAKVLGEFPDETEDTLIPLSWCEQAVNNPILAGDTKVLGVDPARFGDDRTIGYEILKNEAKLYLNTTKEDTTAVAGRIVTDIGRWDEVDIDETGVGGGVVDVAREQLNNHLEADKRLGHRIRGVHFGSKALTPDRFFNLRAEMYWALRERLRPDGQEWNKLKLPDDDELKNELAGIKFTYTSDGRIKIEAKDEIKARLGKSPDKADALVLASWASRPLKPESIVKDTLLKEFFQARNKQGLNQRIRNL